MARAIDLLSEEQQCALRHWIRKDRCDARRRAITELGDGRRRLTYSLRPFDEHRCIFVHVPKAAGISVATALFGNAAGGHRDARYYREVFGRDFWRYYKFTFVRDPFTRLVSAYEFLRRGGHPAVPDDQRFHDEVLSDYRDFPDFVLRWLTPNRSSSAQHFRAQTEYLTLDGKLVMDFIGRCERIENDFSAVCRRLAIPATLERLNVTEGRAEPLGAYYESEAVVRRVRDVYAKDFELLGYSEQVPSR